jgi:hypothetical protein
MRGQSEIRIGIPVAADFILISRETHDGQKGRTMDNISFTAAGSVARFAAMAEYMAEVHEDAGNLATARQLDRLAGFARDRASAHKAKFPCETALPEELREVAAMVVETLADVGEAL